MDLDKLRALMQLHVVALKDYVRHDIADACRRLGLPCARALVPGRA